MYKQHRITVKVTEDIFSKVDNLSQKLGETRSGIIRNAIASFLKEWDSL